MDENNRGITKCAYIHCGTSRRTRPDITLFGFPKDILLARKWVIHAGSPDVLLAVDERLLHRRFLCQLHFSDDSMYIKGNKLKLVRAAIPEKFIAPHIPVNIPNKTYSRVKKEIEFIDCNTV